MKTINKSNSKIIKSFLNDLISIGVDFKNRDDFIEKKIQPTIIKNVLNSIPDKGESLPKILNFFQNKILPSCSNFSSSGFMGFPDSGNSVAAIGGAILKEFCQQNLINQSFCSPIATFMDIAVISWFRKALGYKNKRVKNVWDVGGIITPGGTTSNAVAMLLARENKLLGTMTNGLSGSQRKYVIIPKGLSHYSIKSSLMWIGCGNSVIEVETKDYKYDLPELEKVVKKNKGKIMAIVAYAGDSRTMSVDNFKEIHHIIKRHDQNIWLHADACHGFSLCLSDKYKRLLNRINFCDSITLDPHKVLLIPYTLSMLLVRDPKKMKLITTTSDLIMQEDYAFGQITPFVGSRQWESLKLWFMMKNYGKFGLDKLITNRCDLARYFYKKLVSDKNFLVLNKPEINSVVFLYKGSIKVNDYNMINKVNKRIYQAMLEDGKYYLHQFKFQSGNYLGGKVEIFPLRYMAGNPNIKKKEIDELFLYIKNIAERNIKL